MNYKHTTLKNGLHVFLLPLKDAESVSYTVYTKVGSRYENPKQAGIAHFLEHLFFKGSKQYPTSSLMAQTVDGLGGEWNASTGKEITEYYIRVAKKNFDVAFDLLTDMLLNPLFDAAEIEKEKGVIIEEMRMYRDNYNNVAQENLERIMWPGTQLGDLVIGNEKSVIGIKRDDILNFWKTWYVPANMVIGVAGNFNEKNILAKITKAWGALPAAVVPKMPITGKVPKELTQRSKPEFSLEHKAIEQSNVVLGFQTAGYKEKRNPVISVLSALLGGGMSSRLFMNVRERLGLAYFVYAVHEQYQESGMFVVNAGLRTSSVPEGIRAIIEQLMDIVRKSVTAEELAKVKNAIRGRIALRLEDPQSKLDFMISRFIVYGTIETFDAVMAKIEAVNTKQVLQVAEAIFRNDHMALSVVGPIADKAALRKAAALKFN